jgi:MFS family permease
LPILAQQFKINIIDTNIVVISFLIAYALAIPIVEFLSNRFGLKNTLLIASILFAFSSLGCGLANNIYKLSFFRILQGVAAGFFTPTTRSVVANISDEKSLAMNLTNVQTLGILGQAVGPIFGVYLLRWYGWQSVFYLNIPLCIVVALLIMVSFNMKILNAKIKYKFDYKGYCLVSSAIVVIFLLMFDFEHGIYYNRTILIMLTILAIVLIILSWHVKFYLGTHIINFKLLAKNLKLRIALLISFIARQYTGMIPFFVILLLHSFGVSNDNLGYIMLFYALGLWLAKFVFKFLIERYSSLNIFRYTLVAMFIFNAIAFSILALAHEIVIISILLFVIGILCSIFFSAINLYTLSSINKSDAMSTSTLMSIMMYTSNSSSIALFIAITSLLNFVHFNHYIFAQTLLSLFLMLSLYISKKLSG